MKANINATEAKKYISNRSQMTFGNKFMKSIFCEVRDLYETVL